MRDDRDSYADTNSILSFIKEIHTSNGGMGWGWMTSHGMGWDRIWFECDGMWYMGWDVIWIECDMMG